MLRLWSKIHSDFSQPYFTRGITVAPVIGSRLGLLHLSAQPFAIVMLIRLLHCRSSGQTFGRNGLRRCFPEQGRSPRFGVVP